MVRRIERRKERGTAVLVVLLVILMLTAIGVFATRAAALATMSSGYERQMTQTHYITEYAIMTAAAELSTDRRDAYVQFMKNWANNPAISQTEKLKCTSVVDNSKSPPALISNPSCCQIGYPDLQQKMAQGGPNVLVMPFVPGSPATGGGLGFAPLEADFLIDMTDLGPATPPVAGYDATSGGYSSAVSVKYYALTLSATGKVFPQATTTTTTDPLIGLRTSVELSRAHLVVGPLSK